VLTASLLPPGAPAWVRLLVEVASMVVAARFLLDAVRRLRLSTLALAAAVWIWLFYPPGHAWMLGAARRALAEARALTPAVLGQAMRAAGQATAALASASGAHASSAAGRDAALSGGQASR
jgi:hypothetical protein